MGIQILYRPSECHFQIGRGIGVSSFRPTASDHSNDCFRGDRNLIKIIKIFLSSRCLIFESLKPYRIKCAGGDLNMDTYD
jgi:hypothetical protein